MRRLWRWLCCLTGHHRETVRETLGVVTERTDYGSYCIRSQLRLSCCCVDCGREAWHLNDRLFTPSRRYALKRQGRAA